MDKYNPSEFLKKNKASISPKAYEYINICEEKFDIIFTDKRDEYMPYCEQLLVCAIEEQSDYLFACSYYYLMYYYVNCNDWVNAISCSLEGLKYQRLSRDIEKATSSFNMLGTIYDSIGDTAKAIEYLLSSMDLAKKYNISKFQFMASTNIANIFYINGNFERALFYFNEADKYFSNHFGDEHTVSSLDYFATFICNYGHCLISIGKIDEANECGRRLEEFMELTPAGKENYPVFIVHLFFANLAFANVDREKLYFHLKLAKAELVDFDDFISSVYDLICYIDINLLLKNYEEANTISERFINECQAISAPFNITSRFIEKRIDSAIMTHDEITYAKYAKIFYEEAKKERNRSSEQTLKAENTHFEQQRILRRQKKLLEQSQHDSLTGLPNRAYLNSYAEETLAKAIKENTYFGIEIIDIDFFKHINDNYGHMEGDKYLKNVASVLQKATGNDENIFAARYGGDEFVIVYYDKSPEEISNIMSMLKQDTASIKLPKESAVGCNYLSLSQGGFVKIAGNGNRLWDYLSEADVALYKIKEEGRNNFLLKNI